MAVLSWRRATRWLAMGSLLAWAVTGAGLPPAAALPAVATTRPVVLRDPPPAAWPELPWRQMRVLKVETVHRLAADTTGDGRSEQILVDTVDAAVPGGHLRYYRVRVVQASHRTLALPSPLTSGEALADAAQPPLGIRVLHLTSGGPPFILVAGRGGGTTPVHLYRWDGQAYAVALARAFRGGVRLTGLDTTGPGPAVVGVEPVGPLAAGDGVEVTYRWDGAGAFVPVRVEPRFTSDGGRLVARALYSISRAYLSLLPPEEARDWFTTRFWQDPDGWARWRSATATWVAMELTRVTCCEPWAAQGVVWRDEDGRLVREVARIEIWLAVEGNATRIDRLELTTDPDHVWKLEPEDAGAVTRALAAAEGTPWRGRANRLTVLEMGPTADGRVRVRVEVAGGDGPAAAQPPRRYEVLVERAWGLWRVVSLKEGT